MANKDLVKRAFSVTANLPAAPTQRSASSAGAEESHSSPERGVPAETATTTAPKTGPGSMLAFMTEQSEVHREVVQLRERMSAFDGAQAAKRLDPRTIRASKWANRDMSHFATPAFARLREEIAGAGGNIQPIKVRPVSASPAGEGEGSATFEIVYGHRRHRACLELGIPVFALVQSEMKDAELFVEMERENREREDLSAWEQGVMYMRALEMGLFPSAKQLAAAVDRDMGNISRAMALARLPAEVVAAFGSPLNLQFRWATPLKDAHQRDPEGLLAAARELAARTPAPTPSQVYAELMGDHARRGATPTSEWKDAKGNRVAALITDKRGRVTVIFNQPMEATQRKKLEKLIESLVDVNGPTQN